MAKVMQHNKTIFQNISNKLKATLLKLFILNYVLCGNLCGLPLAPTNTMSSPFIS